MIILSDCAHLLRLTAEILSLDVRVIPVPRLDDDSDVGIIHGEVQEMGGGREVGADGGGGASVLAVAYAELLELGNTTRCHIYDVYLWF